MNRMYIIILLSLFALQCKKPTPPDDDTPPYRKSIELTKDDIGVTEAWLRVKFLDSLSGSSFKLTRNGETILTSPSSKYDTVVIDNGLLPNQTYNYRAYRLRLNAVVDSSMVVTLTTMDTTSHNFTWEIDTLGDGANSILRDVCIINDTCVYAVGEIYKKDSLGNWDTEPYGVARWNGNKWNLMKISYHDYGTTNTWPGPLKTVYGFGPNDIYVTSSANLLHWDGIKWDEKAFFMVDETFNGQVNKIWGTSSSNLYCVGRNGAIYHYNQSGWLKMESGTDVDLTDVWGSPDGSVLWACGYYTDKAGTYLLRCTNSKWEIVYDGTASEFIIRDDSLSGAYATVYAPNDKKIYIGSNTGLYGAFKDTRGAARRYSFTSSYFPGFPYLLRGNEENDMVIAGLYYMIAHFNGYSWRYYNELRETNGRLSSVSQKGNLIFAVGHLYDPINSKGIVIIGRR